MLKKGLNFIAYRCKLNSNEIFIEKKLKLIMIKYKEKFEKIELQENLHLKL